MRLFNVDVLASSNLVSLTSLLQSTLNEIYERKDEGSIVVFRCEHKIDDASHVEAVQLVSSWEKSLRQLEISPAITVFLSDGDTVGHVFDLLLISDFRIVPRNSKIGFSLHGGVIRPRMALYRLANQIGQAYARRMSLAGIAITAPEACSLGLVDEIAEDRSNALEHALEKFKGLSSSELALRRRLLLEAHALEYESALGAYLAACARDHAMISA